MSNKTSVTPVRETNWTKIVDELEEPVSKAWEVVKENKALSVIGGLMGGIATGELIYKYKAFRRHFIVPLAALSAAEGAVLFAEEASYDYADGKYANGALKTAGTVAASATAVDIGTYYLHNVLNLEIIPRLPVYEYVWNNGMTFGGAAIALGGAGAMMDGIYHVVNPDEGIELYFVKTDDENIVRALRGGEFLGGLTALAGGLEIVARGNGVDFRPLTGPLKFLFGNKYGQGTLAVTGGLVSMYTVADGYLRVAGEQASSWNDILGLVETAGGAYGFAASAAWLANLSGEVTFAEAMALDGVWSRLASGQLLLLTGYAGGKYAVNDVIKDGLPGGWGGLFGTGGAMAFLWGAERLNLVRSMNKVYDWTAGAGLGYATVGFAVDAVRNVQDGKYLNAVGNVALGSVTGAGATFFIADAMGNKKVEKLAEEYLNKVFYDVIAKAWEHPLATLGIVGGAAAVGAGVYYATKDDDDAEEKANRANESGAPVSQVQ